MHVLKFKTLSEAQDRSHAEAAKRIENHTTELWWGVAKHGNEYWLVVDADTPDAVEEPDDTKFESVPEPLSEADLFAVNEQIKANKIESLWRAADAYIARYISGVAIGILTIGVSQMKPKALVVTAWTQNIWAEYYARKAMVTPNSVDNLDFSSFGPVPHSVLELKEEVGL